MFNDVIAAVRLTADEKAVQPLYGVLPEDFDASILNELCSDKPQMRKAGTRLAVVVPIQRGGGDVVAWIAWLLNKVPVVTELPAVVEELRTASLNFQRPQSAAASSGPSFEMAAYTAAKRVAGAGRIKSRAMQSVLANALVESGQAEAAAVLWVKQSFSKASRTKPRRAKSPEVSDQTLMPLADELRQMVVALQKETPVHLRLSAADFSEHGLNGALLADMVGVDEIAVSVPAFQDSGLAVIAFRPADDLESHLTAVQNIYDVSQRTKTTRGKNWKPYLVRLGAVVGLFAFIVYLSLPMAMKISATAVSEPARAVAATLPYEAFLKEVHVSVGDRVEVGSALATFGAPQLDEQRNDILLQMKIEELTAQSALSEQDYGAFVLSEQKMIAQQQRLAQIDVRLGALKLTATASGQVISAIAKNITGSFVPVGTDVALIQPEAFYDVEMDIARVDAPLLKTGQTGEVYFRGIANETYPVRVLHQAAVVPDEQTGKERLLARGRIEGNQTNRLTIGLSGFVKIAVDTRPRYQVWSRYVVEYLKEKAWIYLDLRY